MPELSRKRIVLVATTVVKTFLLLSRSLSASSLFFLENWKQQRHRGKKRKREAIEAEDDDTQTLFMLFLEALSTNTSNFRSIWVEPRSLHWGIRVLGGHILQRQLFAQTFRMNRNSFEALHALLEPHIAQSDTRFRSAISSRLRLIAYLLFVTQGMTYIQIANQTGMAISTACKCVHVCTYAICKYLFSKYIHLPSPSEARIIMEKFRGKTNIPGIYGAIDGTHIAIRKPCKYGEDYYNRRKATYTLNIQGSNPIYLHKLMVQALVDHRKRFLDVEIGWPGTVHDKRLFEVSWLSRNFEEVLGSLRIIDRVMTGDDATEEIPAFILGDSAYINSRHFVTTYTVGQCNDDASVRHLNFRLSRARYIVENAFALLKARFQMFEKPVRCATDDLPFAIHLVTSAFVLHNFLIDVNDEPEEGVGGVPAQRIERELQRLREDDRDGDESDTDEDIDGNNGALEEATREKLLRHIMYLDST